MPSKGITVIIPTVGRESVANTLHSVAAQLSSDDHVVVIEEPPARTKGLIKSYANWYPEPKWSYLCVPGGHWGHANRNYVLDDFQITTTHVWTIDDDDIATDWALDSLRTHMNDPWTIFRMTFGDNHPAHGTTCWREKKIKAGDIGTPMIFGPVCPARWGLEYMGDIRYAEQMYAELGDPVWAEDVVALIRP